MINKYNDTLLVTNYWYPYNSPGAIRWLRFGEYMEFDVLTSHKPYRGFKDYTIPFTDKKVTRFGWNIPAILWGFFILPILLFKKYKTYIITSPPESLLFTAWVLQSLGRNVIVDMRDAIDRPTQSRRYLINFYSFFYRKLKNVIVCWKLIDETKPIAYHGYEDINSVYKFQGFYTNTRLTYAEYIDRLKHGKVQDFRGRPKGYAFSSCHTIKKLGYPVNVELANEEYGKHTWEEGAALFNKTIKKINA